MSDESYIRRPYLTLPGATGMPNVNEILAQMPDEQKHRFALQHMEKILGAKLTRFKEADTE